MDTETVVDTFTMKITATIKDIDCNEFTGVLTERFRNEVIDVHIYVLLPCKIFISFFMFSNIIGDKLLLIFSAKFCFNL